jgi:hypothetical protein
MVDSVGVQPETRSSKGTSSDANPGTRREHGNQERSEGGDDYGDIPGASGVFVHDVPSLRSGVGG